MSRAGSSALLGGQSQVRGQRRPALGWAGLGWAGLGWAGLGWAGLAGLGWAGLGWARLGWAGWAGLGWAGPGSCRCGTRCSPAVTSKGQPPAALCPTPLPNAPADAPGPPLPLAPPPPGAGGRRGCQALCVPALCRAPQAHAQRLPEAQPRAAGELAGAADARAQAGRLRQQALLVPEQGGRRGRACRRRRPHIPYPPSRHHRAAYPPAG
jgi:hypothetical protein